VSASNEDGLRAVFRRLARRFDWQLAIDEDALLASATAEYGSLTGELTHGARLDLAVRRAYSVLLYQGLLHRINRAAEEVWWVVFRKAVRDDWQHDEAQDLAQEVVLRLMDRLDRVHSPQGLLSWVFWLYRQVVKDLRGKRPTLPLTSDDDVEVQLSDPADVAEAVEERVVGEELRALLASKLPNARDREILLRSIVLGEKPRQIASDLGIPVAQVRVLKFRALERLRDDAEMTAWVRTLVESVDSAAAGADADD
jgi:RNA polymerase sigma factor (sigma-70 family)